MQTLRNIKNGLLVVALCVGGANLHAQGTAFTYQGLLNVNGAAASGSYDLTFQLFSAATNGVAGPIVTNVATTVSNGLFTASLNFGPGVFPGSNNWVQIGARAAGSSTFTNLFPLMPLTATPYALAANSALTAQTVTGSVGSAGLNGSYTNAVILSNAGNAFVGDGSGLSNVTAAKLSGIYTNVVTISNASDVFYGSGSGLSNISAAALKGSLPAGSLSGTFTNTVSFSNPSNFFAGDGAGLTNVTVYVISNTVAATLWSVTGNVGTVPGSNFVGNRDNEPLQIWANGSRALSLDGTVDSHQPNIIAGSVSNVITEDTEGAVIAGGYQNSITNVGDYSSIGGGNFNTVGGAPTATIGGGVNNAIYDDADMTIAGGEQNTASNSYAASIGGGFGNDVNNAQYSEIGGGYLNQILDSSSYATVGGGSDNQIGAVSSGATIGGGSLNIVGTNSADATISGGFENNIQDNASKSTIGGGQENTIEVGSAYATIPGGRLNVIAGTNSMAAGQQAQALNSGTFVWADSQNAVFSSTGSNQFLVRAQGGMAINTNDPAGAALNVNGVVNASGFSTSGTTGSYLVNGQPAFVIDASADATQPNLIGGSVDNSISTSLAGTVSGGFENTIGSGNYSVIAGGQFNSIASDDNGAILGGYYNTLDGGSSSAIVGGYENFINGATNSVIGGGQGNTLEGASYATIPGGQDNVVSGNFSFAAGQQAQATNTGTFVWADSQNQTFNSTSSNEFLIRASGGVGINTNNPQGMALNVNGVASVSGGVLTSGNVISGGEVYASEFGSVSAQVIFSANGGQALVLDSTVDPNQPNVIGGSFTDTASEDMVGAVIAGGAINTLTNGADFSSIGGGQFNFVDGSVGAGIASGEYNIVTGGNENVIAGGEGNVISNCNYAAVLGGNNNVIDAGAASSSIGGGSNNFIQSNSVTSLIAGGGNNSIGTNNGNTTIGGGDANFVGNSVSNSVISGGTGNSIGDGAASATIPGGQNNVATGNYSLAAGFNAQATNNGAFVWADSQTNTYASTNGDSFNVRAQGGVYFSDGLTNTVSWTPGSGSWNFASDRNIKDRFEKVDATSILDKVSMLPVSEWSYKGHDQRHIGAMAQDFHALFPLNGNDKVLNDTDLHGVELAAIKGLNQKLETQLKVKDAEIQALEDRLERLENKMSRIPNQ